MSTQTAPTLTPVNAGDDERPATFFILVKTAPEFLRMTVQQRLDKARTFLSPIMRDFSEQVELKWYDTEFYSARVTDVWVLEAKSHQSARMYIERLRETEFWDGLFTIEEILAGERNAWAKNYGFDPLESSS